MHHRRDPGALIRSALQGVEPVAPVGIEGVADLSQALAASP